MPNGNRLIIVNKLKIYILASLALFTIAASGQKLPKHQPKYDYKPIHFGFMLGINYYDFHVQTIEDLSVIEPGYYSVRTETAPGYSIGIIANLRLSDHFDLRFIPTFSATERTLIFDVIEPITDRRMEVKRDITSSFIDFPLELKWKSERVKNYRLYVLGGVKYSYDVSSNEDVEDDRVFKIPHNDLAYEFGFGVDIYFEFFKFSPQIKGSWGFADLIVDDGTYYIQGLHRLESRGVFINFTFE